MAKRWSKLKSNIESLFVEKLPLRVHCTDIRKTWTTDGAWGKICVYRTTDKKVVALEDACPHRKLPLSKGRIKNDGVVYPSR